MANSGRPSGTVETYSCCLPAVVAGSSAKWSPAHSQLRRAVAATKTSTQHCETPHDLIFIIIIGSRYCTTAFPAPPASSHTQSSVPHDEKKTGTLRCIYKQQGWALQPGSLLLFVHDLQDMLASYCAVEYVKMRQVSPRERIIERVECDR